MESEAEPNHSDPTAKGRTTEQLFADLYDELRKIAAQRMANERVGDTLQATALVNEAWLRLNAGGRQTWPDESSLIAAASEVMRRILVDRARKKHNQRSGGDLRRTSLDPDMLGQEQDQPDAVIVIDELLELFNRSHSDKVGIVELRFFVGLSFREIAHLTDVSERTVMRQWLFAKAWLQAEAHRQNGGTQPKRTSVERVVPA